MVSCRPGYVALLGSGCGQCCGSAVAAVCRTHVEAVLSALQLPIPCGDFLNHRTLHRGRPCGGYPCARTLAFSRHRTTWHTPILQRHGQGVWIFTWHGFGLRCVQPVSIVRWRRGTSVPTDRNCQGYGMKVPLVLSRATIDTPLHKLGGNSEILSFRSHTLRQ